MASLPHRAQRAALARRLAAVTERVRDRVGRREELRQHVAACAAIRTALAAAGLDPAALWCLREFGGAADALRRLGDTPELAHADAGFVADDPRLARRETLDAKAARRAADYTGEASPRPNASLFEWYAWALANRAGEGGAGEGGRGDAPH